MERLWGTRPGGLERRGWGLESAVELPCFAAGRHAGTASRRRDALASITLTSIRRQRPSSMSRSNTSPSMSKYTSSCRSTSSPSRCNSTTYASPPRSYSTVTQPSNFAVETVKLIAAGIDQHVGDAPEAIGRRHFLQLLDKLAQLHALRLGDGQLGRCGAEDVRPDGVGNAVGCHLRALLRGVRAQAVEAAPCVGLDMHLGAFAGNGGHEAGIEHRELAGLELDDDGVIVGGDHTPVEGLGIDGEAQCRGLRLIIEHAVLERPHVAGHMACDKRRHHGFGEGTVHGNLLEEEQETPGPQGKGPLWVAWVDAARPWKKTDQCGGPHSQPRRSRLRGHVPATPTNMHGRMAA